jgi:hypothetical protein
MIIIKKNSLNYEEKWIFILHPILKRELTRTFLTYWGKSRLSEVKTKNYGVSHYNFMYNFHRNNNLSKPTTGIVNPSSRMLPKQLLFQVKKKAKTIVMAF